ncbi:MAG: hypothetical protein AB7N71_04585 [Phycisphaerae bacterium]
MLKRRSNLSGFICLAIVGIAPLSGCVGVNSLSFLERSAGSEVGSQITVEISSFGSAVTFFILQAGENGGEVSFSDGVASFGSQSMPVTASESVLVPINAVADGQVRLFLHNVANSSNAVVDELLLDVIDGVIYHAGGDSNGNSNANVNENSSGPAATLTFSHLLPWPGVDMEIRIAFAAPCATESVYEISAGNAMRDADGITIPAGATEGSMTMTRTTPGYVRFNVITTGCKNLTAIHDVFFHGAGDLLFAGFAGPVTGSAGAEGMLEVAAEYVTETIDTVPQNAAYWNILYQETVPENFTVVLSAKAAAYVGGGGGTFSIPGGGEYEWSLQPFTTTVPYQGALVGTFTLTRPDNTEETFAYSLPPK